LEVGWADFSGESRLKTEPGAQPSLLCAFSLCASLVRGVTPERPAYTIAFRFKRPDGREVWLEEAARRNSTLWGDLYASRVLLSTSPRASDLRTNKACSSSSSTITSRICWLALLPSPRTCARTAVRSTTTFKHSIGAYDPWPVPTRCSARVAGMVRPRRTRSPSACAQRNERKHDDRRAISRYRSRQLRCWRWCCSKRLSALSDKLRQSCMGLLHAADACRHRLFSLSGQSPKEGLNRPVLILAGGWPTRLVATAAEDRLTRSFLLFSSFRRRACARARSQHRPRPFLAGALSVDPLGLKRRYVSRKSNSYHAANAERTETIACSRGGAGRAPRSEV